MCEQAIRRGPRVRAFAQRTGWFAAAVCLAALAPAPARAGERGLPDFLPSQTILLSDNSVVTFPLLPQPADSVSTIGATAMRSTYPWITGAGQVCAVIDTGMDYTHPALAGAYLTGYDFGDSDANPMDNNPDTGGHGTHVAGIIASRDATYGGVAPGAQIISLKVFPSAGEYASDEAILAALGWVSDHAAQYHITTVNVSLGDDKKDTFGWTHADVDPNDEYEALFGALRSQGVFVSCAAGNSGYLGGLAYPGASPQVVSVGGTWASNQWSPWMFLWPDPYTWYVYDSNSGTLLISGANMADNGPRTDDIMVVSNRYRSGADGGPDLMAPGAIITSSIPFALDLEDGNQDGFAGYLGTSMATAHVSGAAMLVRQTLELTGKLDSDPNRQVDQVLWILQHTGVTLKDWYHDALDPNDAGNNDNILEVPPDSSHWYIRPGSGDGMETYVRIDVNAAINLVYSDAYVPEPATVSWMILGALSLFRRQRRQRIRAH